jgi:hypothetical protein
VARRAAAALQAALEAQMARDYVAIRRWAVRHYGARYDAWNLATQWNRHGW